MGKYNKEFLITFRDVDKNGNLRITALIDFMQDIARDDAGSLGVDFDKMHALYYWVIIRSKINILRTPKIDEVIRIETYHSGVDKLYSVREFQIYDQNDEKIGDITAYYLLMEQGKARPVKLKGNPDFAVFTRAYEGVKVGKLQVSEEAVEKSTRRRVFSSDIDSNGHMNNAHYIRWCYDMFETSELQGREIKALQIQYVKELKENAEISVNRHSDGYIIGECDGTVHFITKIEMHRTKP